MAWIWSGAMQSRRVILDAFADLGVEAMLNQLDADIAARRGPPPYPAVSFADIIRDKPDHDESSEEDQEPEGSPAYLEHCSRFINMNGLAQKILPSKIGLLSQYLLHN